VLFSFPSPKEINVDSGWKVCQVKTFENLKKLNCNILIALIMLSKIAEGVIQSFSLTALGNHLLI